MRLAIVEGNLLAGEAMKLLLGSYPMVGSVTVFASAEKALDEAMFFVIDLLLVDVDLHEMPCSDMITRMKRLKPEIEIMVATICEDRPAVMSALKAGASGYILKGIPLKELTRSLHGLYWGEASMSPRIARVVIREFSAAPHLLTSHEMEVVSSIEHGLTEREIAERLRISTHIVRTRIKRVYEKLQSLTTPVPALAPH